LSCLAFKDVKEPLRTHTFLTARFMELVFLRRNYHLRLEKEGLEPSKAQEGLMLVAILHDIGKAHEGYQREHGGFKGHEIYSGLITYRLAKMLEFDEDWSSVLGLAVALHHHTMIGRGVSDDFKPTERCVEEIKWVLSFLGFEEAAKKLKPSKLTKKEVLSWWMRARKWIVGDLRNLKRIYLLLYPLMISDNMAATVRGGRTLLSRELLDAYWPVMLSGDVCNNPWFR